MSETPSRSEPAESASPYQARKDKTCPFCNKPFTSSSLGRHLDLWIKAKNPKAEDGVHDVEQIRKMRGAITRRQQKKSLGSRRYSSTSAATSAATPVAASKRSPTESSLAPKDRAPSIPGFNVHNFAVTGVINDIGNEQARSVPNPEQYSVTQQNKVSQLNMDMARKIQDAEDTARAAELALREMVSAWRAAKLNIDMSSMPFDFDPLSLDFPALTLQCLEPPPTLSSFNPFPTETSWSIQPPGQQQRTALHAYFSEQFRKWRIRCAAATTALQDDIQYPPSESVFKDDPQEALRRAAKLADDLERKVKEHIDTAYSRWEALPQQRKQDTWILELARSIGKKHAQIGSMQEEQHRLRQETANLKSQIEQLNKLQQPREFKLMSPATLPVEKEFLDFWQEQAVVHGLRTVGMSLDDRRLDLGTVVGTAIDRWKRVVVSHRPSGSGVLGKRTVHQVALDDDDHGDSAVSAPLASGKTATQNKARALSGADGRPLPRPARAGTSGGAGDRALRSTMRATSTNAVGERTPRVSPLHHADAELNGPSTQLTPTSGAAGVSGAFPNGTTPSNLRSEAARVQGDGADKITDGDADAERNDELGDPGADAEKDDGLSDQDADAEMDDDDTLA